MSSRSILLAIIILLAATTFSSGMDKLQEPFLEKLPEDCLITIFTFVPCPDLIHKCSLVCKEWDNIIVETLSNPNISRGDIPRIVGKKLKDESPPKKIKNICVDVDIWSPNEPPALEHFKNIQILRLALLNLEIINLSSHPRLKRIDFHYCQDINLHEIGKECQELNFDHINFEGSSFPEMPKLKKIRFDFCENIYVETLCKCKKLEELRFHKCYLQGKRFSGLPKLEKMTFSIIQNFNMKSIEDAQQLEILVFRNMDFNNQCLPTLKNLRRVVLITSGTDIHPDMLKALPNLETLEIVYVKGTFINHNLHESLFYPKSLKNLEISSRKNLIRHASDLSLPKGCLLKHSHGATPQKSLAALLLVPPSLRHCVAWLVVIACLTTWILS